MEQVGGYKNYAELALAIYETNDMTSASYTKITTNVKKQAKIRSYNAIGKLMKLTGKTIDLNANSTIAEIKIAYTAVLRLEKKFETASMKIVPYGLSTTEERTHEKLTAEDAFRLKIVHQYFTRARELLNYLKSGPSDNAETVEKPYLMVPIFPDPAKGRAKKKHFILAAREDAIKQMKLSDEQPSAYQAGAQAKDIYNCMGWYVENTDQVESYASTGTQMTHLKKFRPIVDKEGKITYPVPPAPPQAPAPASQANPPASHAARQEEPPPGTTLIDYPEGLISIINLIEEEKLASPNFRFSTNAYKKTKHDDRYKRAIATCLENAKLLENIPEEKENFLNWLKWFKYMHAFLFREENKKELSCLTGGDTIKNRLKLWENGNYKELVRLWICTQNKGQRAMKNVDPEKSKANLVEKLLLDGQISKAVQTICGSDLGDVESREVKKQVKEKLGKEAKFQFPEN